jgi:ABC-type sugar transport system ATPase subunit
VEGIEMSEVYVEKITKVFPPRTVALDDVTLLFERSKTTCILGPSGCGKTTLLRIIAGLIKPTKGKVYIDGRDVTNLPANKRNVGMIFQFAVVYDSMTVYENLALPLKSANYSENEIKSRVKEVAETFGISHLLSQRPVGLNIGLRQRIALARAIVRSPKILLLDEPLTNLDPLSRIQLRYELKRLQSNWGQTIIYVTHDQSEALTLGDKIAVMNLGRVHQYGTPNEIYERPADTFCASFIGNPCMNLIEVAVEANDSNVYIVIDSDRIDVSEFREILKDRSKVIFGIRPEHVEVSKERRGVGWFKKRISVIETLGNTAVLNFEIGGTTFKVKTELIPGIKEGEEIWIHFKEDKIRFFDPVSKKLIS